MGVRAERPYARMLTVIGLTTGRGIDEIAPIVAEALGTQLHPRDDPRIGGRYWTTGRPPRPPLPWPDLGARLISNLGPTSTSVRADAEDCAVLLHVVAADANPERLLDDLLRRGISARIVPNHRPTHLRERLFWLLNVLRPDLTLETERALEKSVADASPADTLRAMGRALADLRLPVSRKVLEEVSALAEQLDVKDTPWQAVKWVEPAAGVVGCQSRLSDLLWPFELPSDWTYPPSFRRLMAWGLQLTPPWELMSGGQLRAVRGWVAYRDRVLVPFAQYRPSDDVACWDLAYPDQVHIIHTWTEEGWEQREVFEDFYAWLRHALDEMVEWDREEEGLA